MENVSGTPTFVTIVVAGGGKRNPEVKAAGTVPLAESKGLTDADTPRVEVETRGVVDALSPTIEAANRKRPSPMEETIPALACFA